MTHATLNVHDFFECSEESKKYWLSQMKNCDWGGGIWLGELLENEKNGEFFRLCGDKSKVFLLVENAGGKLISFCTYAEKDDIQPTELTPWIGFVYTFPEFRGRRAFGNLVSHIEKAAKSDGHKAIYVSTNETGLYEKYGFEFFAMMKDFRGEDSRVYKKTIEN